MCTTIDYPDHHDLGAGPRRDRIGHEPFTARRVTGFTVGASSEIVAKWLKLLKEAVPAAARIGVLIGLESSGRLGQHEPNARGRPRPAWQ